MTPAQFVAKWNANTQTERAASQSHFLDLCALLQHPTPNDDPTGENFAFEKGATKSGGGQGYADVWKRDFFAWEYKGKHKDLVAAMNQVAQYSGALFNPPLLVACDMQTLVVRANFPGFPTQTQEVDLRRLDVPDNLEVVRRIFFEPQRFRPVEKEEEITARAADDFARIAARMRERGVDSLRAARFLDRCIFAFFAEDVKLIPDEKFSAILKANRYNPARAGKLIGDLFSKMATGGDFGETPIRHFNGNLFEGAAQEIALLDLSQPEVDELLRAAGKHWQSVSPSVMGTLFERALDPAQRAQLGAHYTTETDIRDLVEPVILAPLREKWKEIESTVGAWRVMPDAPETAGMARLAPTEAREVIENFRDELAALKILDPACGSGNFLFVALQGLLDLEALALGFLAVHGLVEIGEKLEPRVRPEQFFGLEKNPYALDLAQTSLWVGYLQWRQRNGFDWPADPILKTTANFKNMDAIVDASTPDAPREPEWPECDFIVGNPPFLGGSRIWRELGREYQQALWQVWEGRVPGGADLCCYWFEKTRAHIANKKCRRAGLVATQAIRGGANREVLKRIKDSGDIFYAVSDRDWRQDGAAVHISLIAFDGGAEGESTPMLDGQRVAGINANLTGDSDLTQAARLPENRNLSFIGTKKAGAFNLPEDEAVPMLLAPNPGGAPNSDVLRPWLNGEACVQRPAPQWIVDAGTEMTRENFALYEAPFQRIATLVQPVRAKNNRAVRRDKWWLHAETAPGMREAVSTLSRFIATPRVSKYRIFIWATPEVLPDDGIFIFARDDDYFFGVLQSRVHEVWARGIGTQLRERESGFCYTTSCFETFPFPAPDDAARERISQAAQELDALRCRWLCPPEWMRAEVLEFPARADGIWRRFVAADSVDAHGIGTAEYSRPVPRDLEMTVYDARPDATGVLQTRAVKLKDALPRRTLTNLYNERPAWLENAHRVLDEAVFAAYGWDETDLSDEKILARLLKLNLQRAA
jgi:hypothetical protein